MTDTNLSAKDSGLGVFERYLSVWIALAIILALAVLYSTLQLRRRATERLRDTSNDTFLSNTATKGL